MSTSTTRPRRVELRCRPPRSRVSRAVAPHDVAVARHVAAAVVRAEVRAANTDGQGPSRALGPKPTPPSGREKHTLATPLALRPPALVTPILYPFRPVSSRDGLVLVQTPSSVEHRRTNMAFECQPSLIPT